MIIMLIVLLVMMTANANIINIQWCRLMTSAAQCVTATGARVSVRRTATARGY